MSGKQKSCACDGRSHKKQALCGSMCVSAPWTNQNWSGQPAIYDLVCFHFLTTMSVKITNLQNVLTRSTLVHEYEHFGGTKSLHFQGRKVYFTMKMGGGSFLRSASRRRNKTTTHDQHLTMWFHESSKSVTAQNCIKGINGYIIRHTNSHDTQNKCKNVTVSWCSIKFSDTLGTEARNSKLRAHSLSYANLSD